MFDTKLNAKKIKSLEIYFYLHSKFSQFLLKYCNENKKIQKAIEERCLHIENILVKHVNQSFFQPSTSIFGSQRFIIYYIKKSKNYNYSLFDHTPTYLSRSRSLCLCLSPSLSNSLSTSLLLYRKKNMININIFNHIVDEIESQEGVEKSDTALKSDLNYRIATKAIAFNEYQTYKEDKKRCSSKLDRAEKRKSLEMKKKPTHNYCSYCGKKSHTYSNCKNFI